MKLITFIISIIKKRSHTPSLFEESLRKGLKEMLKEMGYKFHDDYDKE